MQWERGGMERPLRLFEQCAKGEQLGQWGRRTFKASMYREIKEIRFQKSVLSIAKAVPSGRNPGGDLSEVK